MLPRVKLTVLCSLAVLAVAPLSAQVHLGIVAGGVSATLSTATADQIPNKSSRTGFAAGLSARWKLAERLSFGPEVLYVQKGAKGRDNTDVIHEEIKIDYIEVPLLFRYALSGGSLRPYLLGGGAVAFRLNCNLHFAGLGQDIKEDCKANNAEATSTDMAAVGGAGVAFGRVGLSVRYVLGLTNIKKASVGNDAIKNRALMGMVSFSM
jgi:hypothetical protein